MGVPPRAPLFAPTSPQSKEGRPTEGRPYKLVVIFVGNRHSAVAAERAWRDLYPGRGLTTFVLRRVDSIHNPPNRVDRETGFSNRLGAHVFLDIRLEDRVELSVGRQSILVLLIRAQLGGRWARDDVLRNYR